MVRQTPRHESALVPRATHADSHEFMPRTSSKNHRFPLSVSESLLAANEWKTNKIRRIVSESSSEDVVGEVLATCGRLKSEVLAQAKTVPPLACAPDGFVRSILSVVVVVVVVVFRSVLVVVACMGEF